jgi:hypothetical protein
MMSVPGVAVAYFDLQKKELQESPWSGKLLYQAREWINGLEAGYLTIPMLRGWGLNRDHLAAVLAETPQFKSLDPKVLDGQEKLDESELDRVTQRVRLLRAAGLLDLLDPKLPDEIVKRLENHGGCLRIPGVDYHDLETTCRTLSILRAFDRMDLVHRQLVARCLVNYPKSEHYSLDYDEIYWLGIGVVALGVEDDLPLADLTQYNRPAIGPASRNSTWRIDPYDVQAFAVNEIVSTRQLLELRYP